MNDVYVEYIEIPDGSPQEMAAFVAQKINEAHAERRTGLSQRYGEMMDVSCTTDWKVEFKGTHFLFLQWNTMKYASKEEFFKEEESA